MDEALGAVHFQLACNDLDIPRPLTLETKVPMPESRMEHLDKSVGWYKKALADLANVSGSSATVMDRIVEKLTMVQTFKANSVAVSFLLTDFCS
jgi:hypothetical protein